MRTQDPNRCSLFILLATIIGAVLWMAFATLVVPGVIEEAYHGRSLSLLNNAISPQRGHSLSDYLVYWDRRSWEPTLVIILLGLLFLLVNRPEFQRYVDSQVDVNKVEKLNTAEEMVAWRRWYVYTLLGVILMGSLFDIAIDTEHWPFSNYAMYSSVRRDPTLTFIRPYGVMSEEDREFPLVEFQYLQPFDRGRLTVALQIIAKRADHKALLHEATQWSVK